MLVQIISFNAWSLKAVVIRLSFEIMVVLFCVSNLSAQQNKFDRDLKFVDYLIDKKMYKEAEFSLSTVNESELSLIQADSLNYYRGLISFFQNDTSNTLKWFNRIKTDCVLNNKGQIACAYFKLKMYKYDQTSLLFNKVNSCNDSLIKSTVGIVLAANALLWDRISEYLILRKSIDLNNPESFKAAKNLDVVYLNKKLDKKKSKVIGGLLSTLVPGLGKWYAGKPTEAIGTFVPVATFGLLAAESYRKAGIKSVGFLGFASLFSVFYLGNVWGSISAVKIRNVNLALNYEKNISLNMYVPIRSLLH